MNHDDFDNVVQEIIAGLPDWVREALDNVDVLVLDEPDEDLVAGDEQLLGLYIGVPLTEREANHAGELPDVIYVFRHPHLGLGLSGEALREEIGKTVIHEIAHYFGIDDDHLDEIGWG